MKHPALSFNFQNKYFRNFLFAWMLLLSIPVSAQINYEHFIMAGQLDLQEENYVEAVKNFNTAIIAKPDAFEGYFLRGIAKFSLGDFQGAINDFSETIKIHPLYVRAWHYRGISRDRVYDYAHAISDLDKAWRLTLSALKCLLIAATRKCTCTITRALLMIIPKPST